MASRFPDFDFPDFGFPDFDFPDFGFPDFDFPDFGFPDFELGGPVAGRLMFWFAVFGSSCVLDFGRSAVCFHVLLWTMRDLSRLLLFWVPDLGYRVKMLPADQLFGF